MIGTKRRIFLLIVQVCVLCLFSAGYVNAEEITDPTKSAEQNQLEQKAREARESRQAQDMAISSGLTLPEDTSTRFTVKEIRISGNSLLTSEELLEDVPAIFDNSALREVNAESAELYDFGDLQEVLRTPGTARQISARTIQGFTQYLLSVYQKQNYGGIYVYVPSDVLQEDAKLPGGVLPVKVIEGRVSDVSTAAYTPENQPAEKSYLDPALLEEWSPTKAGEPINRKDLDDFVNLLNLNPDRYVSTVISRGEDSETFSVKYNVYETDPWHWFAQVDNSGTKDRQWKPKVGLINTNLMGFDDRLTAIYQLSPESDWDENYAVYGGYDFPIMGPKLRLGLFAGYNEFDVSGIGDINFLGRGKFYGGTLRYNVFQQNDWFFDVTGTMSREESKVTPTLPYPGSDIKMYLWGYGIDIYRRDDMSNTLFRLNRNFTIYTTSARHSQLLDPDRIQRLSGSFSWTTSDERLVPAKMTAFGGMYTVRGYDEYEIIADGGILTSLQYEFDLVKYNQSRGVGEPAVRPSGSDELYLKKLAPLVFFDYGLAKMEDAVPGEHDDLELCSWGVGTIVELGDNFTGTVYYGYPLIATDETRTGKGRINAGFMYRW
jgi:hemolysin activation/secretion protein